MKYFTFLILLFCFAISAIGQIDYPDSGFTNKAEAINLMVNGLKEGKWVEYLSNYDKDSLITSDTNVTYYRLMVYKAGKPNGVAKLYKKPHELIEEIPYVKGKINGVRKWFYKSGKLKIANPYKDGVVNGYERMFYEDGHIMRELPCTNGKANGTEKVYYENGRLKSETTYINGKEGETKRYRETWDENK